MKNLGMTVEQAMEALGVPQNEKKNIWNGSKISRQGVRSMNQALHLFDILQKIYYSIKRHAKKRKGKKWNRKALHLTGKRGLSLR